MPPRRRRTGYRDGRMSEDFRRAIVTEADRLEALYGTRGPVAAIDAVGDVYAALDDALAELALPPGFAPSPICEQKAGPTTASHWQRTCRRDESHNSLEKPGLATCKHWCSAYNFVHFRQGVRPRPAAPAHSPPMRLRCASAWARCSREAGRHHVDDRG